MTRFIVYPFFRRLAKSILILIPIFGLHFIMFAWVPYVSTLKLEMTQCFETFITYVETFFNAFQVLRKFFKSFFLMYKKIAFKNSAFRAWSYRLRAALCIVRLSSSSVFSHFNF